MTLAPSALMVIDIMKASAPRSPRTEHGRRSRSVLTICLTICWQRPGASYIHCIISPAYIGRIGVTSFTHICHDRLSHRAAGPGRVWMSQPCLLAMSQHSLRHAERDHELYLRMLYSQQQLTHRGSFRFSGVCGLRHTHECAPCMHGATVVRPTSRHR